MLFDMSASSNSRKIMQLNPEYPKDVTMKSTDGTAVFKAEIAKHGRPDEYTYQWYVNGAAVAEANHKEYERDISGDKGQYTVWCEATNKAGTATSRHATLTVNKVPVLDANYPKNVSVKVGNSATFEVNIAESGYPDSYTYQWYVNWKPVSGATASSYTRKTDSVGAEEICCIVKNEAGSVQTRTAKLTIEREYILKNGVAVNNGFGWYATDPNSYVGFGDGTLNMGCDGQGYAVCHTTGYVNFIGKKKLVFHIKKMVTNSDVDVGVFYFGAGWSQKENELVAQSVVTAYDFEGDLYVTVDVSGLNNVYYVKFLCVRDCYYGDTIHVADIYFE